MHGSPCQDFSIAGKQRGGDPGAKTRSSLMYETLRIVEEIKPRYVIWENVKNLLSIKHKHNFNNYIEKMNELGYNSYYQVLNSKNYGIPQNRDRIFTISIIREIDTNDFRFPEKEILKIKLKDMLEDYVEEKYYLSEEQVNRLKATISKTEEMRDIEVADFRYDKGIRIRKNGLSPCLTTKIGTKSISGNVLLIKNATKKGYIEAEEGDSINLSYPNSKTRRGRVGKGVSQTLQCNENMAVITKELRIRKLTPKECWGLMGFDDKDFEKAAEVNSNSQLYKQAGNSIVVNVLEKILENLLMKGK